MHDDEDDIDGDDDREAMGLVVADLGNTVKRMRRQRLQKPTMVVKVQGEGGGPDGLSPDDPVASGDGELTEAELAKLEELC